MWSCLSLSMITYSRTNLSLYESPNNHLAGVTYENFPHQFSGYNIQSTGEQSRPKLQVANPDGLFSNLLVNGTLRQAQLIRYLVLRSDLLADESRYLRTNG